MRQRNPDVTAQHSEHPLHTSRVRADQSMLFNVVARLVRCVSAPLVHVSRVRPSTRGVLSSAGPLRYHASIRPPTYRHVHVGAHSHCCVLLHRACIWVRCAVSAAG
eukprot:4444211-Prymnesium_polylepis.1